MSAFIVENDHIHALLTAALTWKQYGQLSWMAPESEEPAGEADYQAGEPWGPTSIETATRRRREIKIGTADSVGFMLLAQNYASVNYRYNEHEFSPVYRFTPLAGQPDPIIILKALDCYEYQSCETPDWEQTEAHAFCQALRKRAINQLPGYGAAPWRIDDAKIFQPQRSSSRKQRS